MKIVVGLKLFVLNVKTNKITETYVKEIAESDSDQKRFIGYLGSTMVVLHKYPNPVTLSSLLDHLRDNRRTTDALFIGQEIFAYSNLRVFVALTEKECYQHLVNTVIPYQITRVQIESEEIVKKYHDFIDQVGSLEQLSKKIKSEKL
jgi:hypothetical protein